MFWQRLLGLNVAAAPVEPAEERLTQERDDHDDPAADHVVPEEAEVDVKNRTNTVAWRDQRASSTGVAVTRLKKNATTKIPSTVP